MEAIGRAALTKFKWKAELEQATTDKRIEKIAKLGTCTVEVGIPWQLAKKVGRVRAELEELRRGTKGAITIKSREERVRTYAEHQGVLNLIR